MDPPDIERPSRPFALAGIAATGILAGAFVGGSTNSVNALVSPQYFINILRWHNVEDIWRASIAQGIFEGLLFGLIFSLIFTSAAGIVTGAACTYGFAFRHLLGIVGGAFAFWLLGGLAAMGLAALSPAFYRATFIGVPDDFGDMMRYAWMGGSIWGAQLGGFFCLVVGLVMMRSNWRRLRV